MSASQQTPPEAEAADAVPPAPTETPAVESKRPSFFRRLSPLGRIISAAIALISFATGIIAVVPIFTKDSTNFGSLRLTTSEASGALEFALPTSVVLTDFPEGSPGSCGPTQQAWLESHGTRITTTYLVDMQNAASDGPMLALNNFRGDGEAGAELPQLRVVCDATGVAPDRLQAARLMVSDPEQVAYFDKSTFGQTAEGIPDSPVAWNLAPGEVGQILITLFPTSSFTGRLTLTALSGSETKDFVVAEEVSVPALVRGGASFLKVDGGLSCFRIDGAARAPCEVAELLG